MRYEKLIRGLKICAIIFLVLAIAIVSLIQWKSDAIVARVLSSVQSQLSDSLTYDEVHMDAFSHFPCASVQLTNLQLGQKPLGLIEHGNVDIIIGLWPLLHDAIDIYQIQVSDANIHIVYRSDHWSYDILKKTEGTGEGKSWKTLIRQLKIVNSQLFYSDGQQTEFELMLDKAECKGKMDPELLDMDLQCEATMNRMKTESYTLPESLAFHLDGGYAFDLKNSVQTFRNWKFSNDAISLTMKGDIMREKDNEVFNLEGNWVNGKPELLKTWVPEKTKASWKPYTFYGESEGTFEVKGKSSRSATPSFVFIGKLKNGGFATSDSKTEVKNVNLDFDYKTQDPEHQKKSTLHLVAEKKSTFGKDMKGDIMMIDFDHPVYDISLEGNIPMAILNIFSAPTLIVESGELQVDEFKLHQFRPGSDFLKQLIANGKIKAESNELKCTYYNNPVSWTNGQVAQTGNAEFHFQFDALNWDKASAKDLKGDLQVAGEQIKFNFSGGLAEGKVESKGTLTTSEQRQVFQADWVVKEIAMQKLMESFSNFDQTFITSENISGIANIWSTTTIPMDAQWKIKTKEVVAKCAIEIHEGRLKNLQTLEDFSDYVHVEDLRDIHFHELRNFLKIEDAKVYLPVMFIQSTAMNLSIAGVHGFDQKILYNMKLNAGQTVANKLKKTDFRKDLKTAKKSGWINMYFVLEGTTSNVRYQQYRTAVISGFEQSTQLKESLRNEMVSRFGYDVYWLEPNEWEDIPEYK